jgi:hypothetical protein
MMMKTKLMVAIVPVLLLSPLALHAQATTGRTDGQSQAQLPQARIDAAVSAAAKAGIPAQLVDSKIAEGEAKRVPMERIAAAVEARVTSLIHAKETLQHARVDVHSAGDLAVTADALDAGVSQSALIQISRDAPSERRAVAIAVLADLVRLGNASDRAFTRVEAALSTSAALANLHAEVASQLRLSGLNSTLDVAGLGRIR